MTELLTAMDLTANSLALQPALPSEKARWRSGDVEDCKSSAVFTESETVSDLGEVSTPPATDATQASVLTEAPKRDTSTERQTSAPSPVPLGKNPPAPSVGDGGSGEKPWSQDQAITLCKLVEAICPEFGCHVALTGGLLYKEGPRKDCDLLFYRIRQIEHIDVEGLFAALSDIGLTRQRGFGWCYKAEFDCKPVDCFFPENEGGEYVSQRAVEMLIDDPKMEFPL